jgi:hypothetical protein
MDDEFLEPATASLDLQPPLSDTDTPSPSLSGNHTTSRTILKFPLSTAGAPMSYDGQPIDQAYGKLVDSLNSGTASNATNAYAPFASKTDWDVAQWAKLRGCGSTAFSELLAIDNVRAFKSVLRIY